MDIEVKRMCSWADVKVQEENTTISFSLYGDDKRIQLAKKLKDAIQKLLDADEYADMFELEE